MSNGLKHTLLQLNNNLNTLREREAKYGGSTPVDLLNQITDYQKAITLTWQAINGSLNKAEWRQAMAPLNIDHTLIDGGFFQKVLQALSLPNDQQRELRNRQIMLQRVYDFWVQDILESSLYNEVLIDLGMESQPGVVEYPWDVVLQQPDRSGIPLDSGTPMLEVFEQSGGSLLILGAPGSGKTTMLLELARQTITQAQIDPSFPMPVVFNLSTWPKEHLSLTEWLQKELFSKYNISQKLAARWIKNDTLLLLLDGLDEVDANQRQACVNAINQFIQEQMTMMAVCCRSNVYQVLPTRLRLQDSVALQPLSTTQVNAYLNRIGDEASTLQTALQNNPTLQKLAASPLMLTIMTLVSQEFSAKTWQMPLSLEAYQAQVFRAYIRHMFKRKGSSRSYQPQQTMQWLAGLAQKLKQHGRTTFLIEDMQASWLPTSQQQLFYQIALRIVGGSAFFMAGSLSALLFALWVIIMTSSGRAIPLVDIFTAGITTALAFVAGSILAARRWTMPFIILTIAVIIALLNLHTPLVALFTAIIFGLPGVIAGMPLAQQQNIQVNDAVRWHWKKGTAGLLLGLAVGLVGGKLNDGNVLVDSLQLGLTAGLILSLALGLSRVEYIDTRTSPGHGLRRSVRHGLRLGFGIILIILLFSTVLGGLTGSTVMGFAFGLLIAGPIGLAVGLYAGGNAGLQHGLLHAMLFRNNQIPWRWINFLDYAVDRIFLRRAGQGYIFIHQWFLDRFDTLDVEEQL